jgi:UDP-N-acetyl-D-glucosamine dehydrogenase
VLVLGVAYKRDVDDVRESPALEVIRHLLARGAEVSFADPHVPSLAVGERTFERVAPTPEVLAAADCVVVVTDHAALPWDDVAAHASLIVDSRGAVPRSAVRGTLVPLSGPAVSGEPVASRTDADLVRKSP